MDASSLLIDRDRLVVVLVDIQEKLAASMDRGAEVVDNAVKLARVAGIVGAPVVVTRHYPKGLGHTAPEIEHAISQLEAAGMSVYRVDKVVFCCAHEPGFTEALRSTGRDQVVLAGMETHICVTQTALALADEYSVHVTADATCSRVDSSHDLALARLRTAGVDVTPTESVMYEAVGVAGTPEFKQLLGIVKGE